MALLGACAADVDAGGHAKNQAVEPDPLDVPSDAAEGSLDALHHDVLLRSCAAQPGLCHSGQFEPNLSTPALAYENLVARPSLEHAKQHRVMPGHPEKSLLVDKLRDHMVISRMPLGAAPLAEEAIASIEHWIEGGALRAPGASPASAVNNPPDEPRVVAFDEAGKRVTKAIAADEKLVLRMTVKDFETADADMIYTGFYLFTADGKQLYLDGTEQNAGYILASYQPKGAPMDKQDPLAWAATISLPKMLKVSADGTTFEEIPAAGQQLTAVALYADGDPGSGAMIAFAQVSNVIGVMP